MVARWLSAMCRSFSRTPLCERAQLRSAKNGELSALHALKRDKVHILNMSHFSSKR